MARTNRIRPTYAGRSILAKRLFSDPLAARPTRVGDIVVRSPFSADGLSAAAQALFA